MRGGGRREEGLRVNGWQRLGVLATAIWIAGVASLVAIDYYNPPKAHLGFVKAVPIARELTDAEVFAPNTTPPKGWDPVSATWTEKQFQWGVIAAALLLCPVLAWLFVYGAIRIVKWVAAGFKQGRST